jgi:hypothetical protein
LTSARELVRLMIRHPFALGTVPLVASHAALKLWLRREQSIDRLPGQDPELMLYELRGNWVLRALETTSPELCVERFAAAQRHAAAFALDAYSSSQRLANAIYLLRAVPAEVRRSAASRLGPGLTADACYLRKSPEFRRNGAWFGNHLLNNYRAAALVATHRDLIPDAPDLNPFCTRIGAILDRHRPTLFGADGILLEGSVSYEILGLKHIADIACCGIAGSFATRLREWARSCIVPAAMVYRKDETWLLPQIGDSSPDWDTETMEFFLDGVVLGHDTVYRRIWRAELSALGL